MAQKIDMTEHAPAALARPSRHRTTAVIVHHVDVGAAFADVVKFFTADPEGVATVTLSGSYASKAATIAQWKAHGVPAAMLARAFVPYHFLVDATGLAARMLRLEAIGAHAGNWNDRSVAVCCLGTFDAAAPTAPQYDECRAVVADILSVYPSLRVIDHDQSLAEDGNPKKGCAGARFPMHALRTDTGGKA